MENTEQKNTNLGDPRAENTVGRTNMPENQVPRFRSNENHEKNRVKSEAGFLSREVGEGDFGSEEARADWEKGNPGEAGNMPNSVARPAAGKKADFPARLREAKREITGTEWKTSETLEIILAEATDLEKFVRELQQEINDFIGFGEHIDLVIKKENDAYFRILEINRHSTGVGQNEPGD